MTIDGHVVVVAQEDGLRPLSTADHLGTNGAWVTVVYGGNGPAPLVSRYLIGSVLVRLDAHDTTLRCGEQVVGIQPGHVQVRNVYSNTVRTLTEVDAVVLACGPTPDYELFAQLQNRDITAHILGDAYALRRLVWATRQAYDLAVTL